MCGSADARLYTHFKTIRQQTFDDSPTVSNSCLELMIVKGKCGDFVQWFNVFCLPLGSTIQLMFSHVLPCQRTTQQRVHHFSPNVQKFYVGSRFCFFPNNFYIRPRAKTRIGVSDDAHTVIPNLKHSPIHVPTELFQIVFPQQASKCVTKKDFFQKEQPDVQILISANCVVVDLPDTLCWRRTRQ